MKTPLFFHIGMGKTGTTLLQSFFKLNQSELAVHQICYPNIAEVANAHHLASTHRPIFLENTNWQFLEPDILIDELHKLEAPRILLSTELMSSASDDNFKRLFLPLAENFDLTIVVYLRRQDQALMSSYSQAAKAGVLLNGQDVFIKTNLPKFDYNSVIENWKSLVPNCCFQVLAYDRLAFYQQNLVADFMNHVFQIDDIHQFELPKNTKQNTSWPIEAIEFKRFVNNLFRDDRMKQNVNIALENYAAQSQSNLQIFSDAQMLEILSHFTNSNAALGLPNMLQGTALPNEKLDADVSINESIENLRSFLARKYPRIFKRIKTKAREDLDGGQFAEKKRIWMQNMLENIEGVNPSMTSQAIEPAIRADRILTLHVGMPKTATTLIQDILFHNRDFLEEHDIFYPKIFDRYLGKKYDANHTKAFLAAFETGFARNTRFRKMSDNQCQYFHEEMIAYFRDMLIATPQKHIVISGEGIQAMKRSGLRAFNKEFGAMFSQIQIVIGIREPIKLYTSVIQQNLKSGMSLQQQYGNLTSFMYQQILSKFMDEFGRKNVIIWDFEQAKNVEGGVLASFCRSIGIDESTYLNLTEPETVNKNISLNQAQVEMLNDAVIEGKNPQEEFKRIRNLKIDSVPFSIPEEIAFQVQALTKRDYQWIFRNSRKANNYDEKRVFRYRFSEILEKRITMMKNALFGKEL